jgi:hypothetical protein
LKALLVLCGILAMVTVTLRLQVSLQQDHKFVSVFPVYYRATVLLVLGGWCWGFNVQGLDRASIEYTVLFDTDPSLKIPAGAVYGASALFTVLLLINVIAFTQASGIPSTLIPLCLYASTFLLLLWPREPFLGPRQGLLRALSSVLFSPVTGVAFGHVILADLLTSYSKVFADMYSTMCVIVHSPDRHFHPEVLHVCRHDTIGPLVASLPSWLRLLQCLRCYASERERRHLFNALKYASAFPVLALSHVKQSQFSATISHLWLASLLVNSLFSFYWDVYHDWGLGSVTSANWLLRDRLLFSRRWWYYATLLVDFLLRFTWSLQLSPHWWFTLGGSVGRELQMFVLETLEILRRCLWIFFRCEWQHLTLSTQNKGHHLRTPSPDR